MSSEAMVYRLSLTAGDSYQSPVFNLKQDGVAFDLTQYAVKAQMRRRRKYPLTMEFEVEYIDKVGGSIRLSATPDQTNEIPIPMGRRFAFFRYDVQLTNIINPEDVRSPLRGPVVVYADITK